MSELLMDNDKPSATALLIAKSQLLLAAHSLYSQAVGKSRTDYYRSFVEAVMHKPWQLGSASRYWLKLIERISIPGVYLHYALRKRCIEQVAREFLDTSQIQQMVAIAGGFDPLLAMLSEQYANVTFFELDHPATQKVKRSVLTPRANLLLLPVDLTKQSVSDVLLGMAFSPDKPTLFIAEGITMYLNESEIKRFFQQVQSCTQHNNSHFLFTYMHRQPSGSIQFESATKLVDHWLWLKKEVFKWGVATEELAAFLTALGYRLVSVFDADYFMNRYLPDTGRKDLILARGEYICLAKIRC